VKQLLHAGRPIDVREARCLRFIRAGAGRGGGWHWEVKATMVVSMTTAAS
jgi:hypothetical protein